MVLLNQVDFVAVESAQVATELQLDVVNCKHSRCFSWMVCALKADCSTATLCHAMKSIVIIANELSMNSITINYYLLCVARVRHTSVFPRKSTRCGECRLLFKNIVKQNCIKLFIALKYTLNCCFSLSVPCSIPCSSLFHPTLYFLKHVDFGPAEKNFSWIELDELKFCLKIAVRIVTL